MRSFRHQSVVPAVWPGLRGCCFFSPLPYPFRRLNRMNWPLPCRQLDRAGGAGAGPGAAGQSGASEPPRYFFDYPRARADLETIRDGIDRYLTPSRAQPRTTSAVNGHYRRERP